MSIDAVIRDTEYVADGILLLRLEPRFDKRVGHFQPSGGRPYLYIITPTWDPVPGMPVWGGDRHIEIGGDPAHRYSREGLHLREEEL